MVVWTGVASLRGSPRNNKPRNKMPTNTTSTNTKSRLLATAAPIYGALLTSNNIDKLDPSVPEEKRKAVAAMQNLADFSIIAAQTLIKGVTKRSTK